MILLKVNTDFYFLWSGIGLVFYLKHKLKQKVKIEVILLVVT